MIRDVSWLNCWGHKWQVVLQGRIKSLWPPLAITVNCLQWESTVQQGKLLLWQITKTLEALNHWSSLACISLFLCSLSPLQSAVTGLRFFKMSLSPLFTSGSCYCEAKSKDTCKHLRHHPFTSGIIRKRGLVPALRMMRAIFGHFMSPLTSFLWWIWRSVFPNQMCVAQSCKCFEIVFYVVFICLCCQKSLECFF